MNPAHHRTGRVRVVSDDPVVQALDALAARLDVLAEAAAKPAAPVDGVVVPKWAVTLIGGLLSTAVIALTVSVLGMNTRLSVIENNRFTPADAAQLRRDIETGPPNAGAAARLREHENRITRLEGRHGGNAP